MHSDIWSKFGVLTNSKLTDKNQKRLNKEDAKKMLKEFFHLE